MAASPEVDAAMPLPAPRARAARPLPGAVLAFALFSGASAHADEVLPTPAAAIDHDHDGIDDAREGELLAQYAPIVLLAGDETAKPASVSWIRARTQFVAERRAGVVTAVARPFDAAIRAGSRDRADWTMYGHVYRRRDGGTNVQFWFYFAWNEAPLFFAHESDWEHVTVELGADGIPQSVAYAQHNDNAPGRRVRWSEVPREGVHPFVLTARGTHASYPSAKGVPFWETVRDCPRRTDGAPELAGCAVTVWRAGEGGSRVLNLGERGAPEAGEEAAFVTSFPGAWGAAADGGGAPAGPPFQRGFCADAAPGGCG